MANRVLTEKSRPVLIAARIENNPCVFFGAITSAQLSTTYAGKHSHRTAKYTPDGFPKNFDRRSDVTYKMHAVITPGDDTTEEKTSTISYKFKSEETTAVGSCVLQVIHGKSDATNDAARTSHTFQLYFPELRISATAVDAEPIVDSLSTVFFRDHAGELRRRLSLQATLGPNITRNEITTWIEITHA